MLYASPLYAYPVAIDRLGGWAEDAVPSDDTWVCRGCGKVNSADQLACGEGQWDGCGGSQAEYAV
jgi:hypothetical protein